MLVKRRQIFDQRSDGQSGLRPASPQQKPWVDFGVTFGKNAGR